MVPLYGFVEGDALGVVVLAHAHESLQVVGVRLQQATEMRIAPWRAFELYAGPRALPLDQTVADAGLTALDRIDLVRPRSAR